MGMSLSVNREKLLAQLTEKLDKIDKFYDDEKVKLEAALTALTTGKDAWANYHREIAECLDNGDYVYDNGRIKVARDRHGRQATGKPLPDKPDSKQANNYGNRQQIENNLEWLEQYRQRDLEPVRAAISILNLSEDESITIEGSDYDRLLSQSVGRNFAW